MYTYFNGLSLGIQMILSSQASVIGLRAVPVVETLIVSMP
jgi:hypothetical protein